MAQILLPFELYAFPVTVFLNRGLSTVFVPPVSVKFLTDRCDFKGVRKGDFGVEAPPLELDILQKLYHLRAKEIYCFRILFACLST